ncbi:Uncharacterised protein [Chlamydia trachomatis]|nr:Uncharacterised protein [Chlamydia trachomatis]CRH88308.1 Uncharacterised protein [Chlamydia trachomatis]
MRSLILKRKPKALLGRLHKSYMTFIANRLVTRTLKHKQSLSRQTLDVCHLRDYRYRQELIKEHRSSQTKLLFLA